VEVLFAIILIVRLWLYPPSNWNEQTDMSVLMIASVSPVMPVAPRLADRIAKLGVYRLNDSETTNQSAQMTYGKQELDFTVNIG